MPYIIVNWILSTMSIKSMGEWTDFSTNDAETTGYSHAKKIKLDPASHHIQKLTQNGSET